MADQRSRALLGDSPSRAYAEKLELFNRFAEPEIRQAVADLGLRGNERVLDVGCGAGLITAWLAESVAAGGLAVGLDLAASHVRQAARNAAGNHLPLHFIQGDMNCPPFAAGAFDGIWCSNTLNHLRDPVDDLQALLQALRPGGFLAVGQSAFVPDMMFAWNARLEKEVMLACRRYYRDKYGLDERDTTAARNVLGLLQRVGLCGLRARTYVIERIAPLTPAEERYFLHGVFRSYWDHRVKPYLAEDDWHELSRLCDPQSPVYCLRRPDFHHIQTFTVVTGYKPARVE